MGPSSMLRSHRQSYMLWPRSGQRMPFSLGGANHCGCVGRMGWSPAQLAGRPRLVWRLPAAGGWGMGSCVTICIPKSSAGPLVSGISFWGQLAAGPRCVGLGPSSSGCRASGILGAENIPLIGWAGSQSSSLNCQKKKKKIKQLKSWTRQLYKVCFTKYLKKN